MDKLAIATGEGSTSEKKAKVQPKHFATSGFSLSRRNIKITRRHSSITASASVQPTPEPIGENDPAVRRKLLRRSTTRRVLGESSPSRTLAAIGRKRSANEEKETNGSPYEDIVERFQIRQLQRSPSTRTAQTDDKRSSFTSSHRQDDDLNRGGEDLEQDLQKHQLRRKHSSLYSGNNVSLADEGEQVASRLHSQSNNSHNSSVEEVCKWGTALEPAIVRLRTWQYKLLAPISPFSRLSQARYVVVLLITVAYVLWLPLELAFPDQHSVTDVEVVIGILLSIDVILTLHTGYSTTTGIVIISHWRILWNYMKTRLLLDVLLVISLFLPINPRDEENRWLTFMFGGLSSARLAYILRFIRIMWLIRSNQNGGGNALWAWLQYSRYSHLIRIAAIVVALLVIAHYIACVWTVLLVKIDPFYEYGASWGDIYAASFYSALTLLQGNGVPTSTASQNVFASLSVLVGSIVLAVVFGHVAVLVSNFNANTTEYQRKMEEVYAMTTKLQLPPSLRRRIHEYYEHLWHEYECIDGDIVQFSKELSHTLGLEIVLIKYMDLVMTVPFWKDCSADFQKQLMLRLDVRVYLPNDFIMREGEVGDEFYMVNRGYCELVRDLDKFERVTNTIIGRQVTRTSFSMGRTNGRARRNSSLNLNVGRISESFNQSPYELDPTQRQYYSSTGRHVENQYGVLVSRGQVFGDLALVMNYQRAANVRAITHVEMCILSRKNFQEVLARYPDDRRRIIVEMFTSYMQSYELSQSHCPLLDMVRSVYSPEAIRKAGGTPPLTHSILTTRQAAERIYTAINAEMNDPTIKFGVGGDIREQLIQLRERRREVRRLNEATVKQKLDSKPMESTKTKADTSATMEEPGDLQIRLQQALERETAILKTLQDLKINLEGSLHRGVQNSEMKLHNSTSQAVPAYQQQRSGDFTAEIPGRPSGPAQTQTPNVPDSNSSPMRGGTIGSSENPRVRLHVRRLARRSQSQKLTEEMVSKHKVKSRASIGSSPTRPGQIYRLRSPTPTDATKSPTYYADALFRAR